MHTHVLQNQSSLPTRHTAEPNPDHRVYGAEIRVVRCRPPGRRMKSYCLNPELLMALSQGFLKVKIEGGGSVVPGQADWLVLVQTSAQQTNEKQPSSSPS